MWEHLINRHLSSLPLPHDRKESKNPSYAKVKPRSMKPHRQDFVFFPFFQFDIPMLIGGNKDEGIMSYLDFLR